jgi:spermidine synthase
MRIAFAIAIGLGALLLFQVQFILGKQTLPWFGGVPAVWSTCLVFFQTLLLAGYAYAHALTWLPARRQMQVHVALVGLAVALLAARAFVWPSPITPGDGWRPDPDGAPVGQMLTLLTAAVALPYLVLASTGPLLQRWWAAVWPDASPYRLYALSNAGSLLGLLGYPFVVERLFAVPHQGWLWAVGFLAYGAAAIGAARQFDRAGLHDVALKAHVRDTPSPSLGVQAQWFWLAAVAAALLQATTAWLTVDVAAVPLLWMAPLALYLLTFIVAFEYPRVYHRLVWTLLAMVALSGAAAAVKADTDISPAWHMLAGLSCLGVACMFCHGELGARTPHPAYLTRFYLWIAAGGAAGSASVSMLAPRLFTSVVEYPVALVLVALALFSVHARGFRTDLVDDPPPWWARVAAVAVVPLVAGLVSFTVQEARDQQRDVLVSSRNFFGWVRVREGTSLGGAPYRRLLHGNTIHGVQFTAFERELEQTSYYMPTSGVGRALLHARTGERPLTVGIVGLGTGTLASYGRESDRFRFYEIDPQVIALSSGERPVFTFVSRSDAEVTIVPGDARLSLDREPPVGFDVLALDAFSSDAVPGHLLTVEAFRLYARHLRTDESLLAVHVSNRFLDLEGIVRSAGMEAGLASVTVSDFPDDDASESSTWMLLARSREVLRAFGDPDTEAALPWVRPWTDTWSNLFDVIER